MSDPSRDPQLIRPVVGYEGRYEVDRYGNVYSLLHNKRKKLATMMFRTGYLYVNLYRKGEISHPTVHRIVAKAFLPQTDKSLQVNHLDSDKQNNAVENLEWCSRQENMEHAFSKRYEFLNTEGNVVVIHNLEKYCRDHHLDASNMHKVASGKRKVHRGYTLKVNN